MYNKYKSKRTVCREGHIHDSAKEAVRCEELCYLQRFGKIRNLKIQREFVLIPARKYSDMPNERKCSYIADFCYMQNGKLIVEDTKGYKTRDYIIKRKLFKEKYCQSGMIIFKET